MKESNEIKNNILINEYLSKSEFKTWSDAFVKYNEIMSKDASILHAKPFRKYTFNLDFIDIIFKALHNIGTRNSYLSKAEYYIQINKEFIEIENKLIIFRDLLFYFNTFKKRVTVVLPVYESKFKYLTSEMLNFKYITDDDLLDLKNHLSKFKFYIFGIDSIISYYGIETINYNKIYPEFMVFSIECDNFSDRIKRPNGNLLIFEKAFSCKYNDISLLKVEDDFDSAYFNNVFLM